MGKPVYSKNESGKYKAFLVQVKRRSEKTSAHLHSLNKNECVFVLVGK